MARSYLQALLDDCYPIAKRRKTIQLLVEDAISEDYDRRKEARPLLLAYTFGKPKEHIEHSGKIDIGRLSDDDLRAIVEDKG